MYKGGSGVEGVTVGTEILNFSKLCHKETSQMSSFVFIIQSIYFDCLPVVRNNVLQWTCNL